MGNKLRFNVKKVKLKRKVNGVSTEGYYGRVISNGKKDFATVAEESCLNTSINVVEMKAAAELFLQGATRIAKQGYIVDLGPLGTLYPSVDSVWHTDPDDVKISELKPRLTYKPSNEIKSAIESAKLGWVSGENSDDEEEENVTPSNGGNSNTPDPDENLLG